MVRAVVTTSPDTTVEALARLMINLGISGVPVLDKDGRLVGIITEGDLLRRVEIGTERWPRGSEPFSSNSRLAAEYEGPHDPRPIARRAAGTEMGGHQ
jgi:CBS-domain-containing membrane protein